MRFLRVGFVDYKVGDGKAKRTKSETKIPDNEYDPRYSR